MTNLSPHIRFYTFHRWIARQIGKWPGALSVAAALGPFLHPSRKPTARALTWAKGGWHRYLQAVCVATTVLYRMRDFNQVLKLSWNDPDRALDAARERGGLILTYHHPFAYHFPAFIGSQGIPLDMLALSPEESALYPLYDEYVASWFADSQTHFCGGKWVFLHKDGHSNMRAPVRRLKSGGVVISLHDFPNFYPNSTSIPIKVLDLSFAAPEGVLALAVKARLPISVGYVDWLGGDSFEIKLHSLNSNGSEALTSIEVLQRYTQILEDVLRKSPEFWESWGWFPVEQ